MQRSTPNQNELSFSVKSFIWSGNPQHFMSFANVSKIVVRFKRFNSSFLLKI